MTSPQITPERPSLESVGTPVYSVAPTAAEIDRIAREAILTLPGEIADHVSQIVVHVEEFPDAEVEREMELESPFDLLGLYHGISLAEKSVGTVATQPDMIFLYRRPILDYWCETGEDLGHLVRHVIIHEIGHHFGLSDDDMDRIEASVP